MKRRKEYQPRTGIRFDRRHVQGGDAGFIGADVEVMTVTGSVERSTTQQDGDYAFVSVPLAGFPRSANDMKIACAGKGDWVDGYLLEETDSGITSSFDTSHRLNSQNQQLISYRLPGFRGPADDYAIGFSNSGTIGNIANFNAELTLGLGAYALTTGSDLAVMWVARQKQDTGYMFSKTSGGSGWVIKGGGIASGLRLILEFSGIGGTTITSSVAPNAWYAGLWYAEKGTVNKSRIVLHDLVTRRTFPGDIYDLTSFPDVSDPTGYFRFGGAFTSVFPAEMAVSAFYIASGTNAASGIFGNEDTILRSFANVISAKNAFLFSGTAETDRSLASFGNASDTAFLNQRLLGLGTASLGRSRGYTLITTGSIPSWTNAHIRNSAFVATPFSSSNHESQVLNAWRSGSEGLEQSSVPASSTLYFSKKTVYQTLTVKKTASFFDTVVPFSGAIVPSSFLAGTGSLLTIVTGSNTPSLSCSYRYPATIRVDVPTQGKIVDLKVWIEIVHHSSSNGQNFPLGSLGIALRSPNVRWGGHAHPVRNDPKFITAFKNPIFAQAMILGSSNMEDVYYPAANFFRDTFLLWESHAVSNDGEGGPWPGSSNGSIRLYPDWDRDRSMRTVFSDGAIVRNPRHLIGLMSGNYSGSPNQGAGFTDAWGFNVPWTSDRTGLSANDPTTYLANGSPPKGWLTGPGGSNADNEWPTTGSNYGAAEIRPIYPMLDPIYQKKRIGDEAPIIGSIVKAIGGIEIPQENPGLWRGFRPGLRGTQMSGTWEILFSQNGRVGDFASGRSETERINAYFRQVRLEFIYEDHEDLARIRAPQLGVPNRMGDLLVTSISGSGNMLRDDNSGSWDGYISETIVDVPGSAESSRTFGVVLNTGSVDFNGYSLIYRLTGTLADVSGSAPGWLLNNRFGMPQIPLSSASLAPEESVPVTGIHPQDILTIRPAVSPVSRLSDAAQDSSPKVTRAEYFEIVTAEETEE